MIHATPHITQPSEKNTVRGVYSLGRLVRTADGVLFINHSLPTMKKILTSLLIAGLVLVPSLSLAATYTPAQISAMQQELSALQSELSALISSQTTSTAETSSTVSLLPQFTSAMSSVASECDGSYQGNGPTVCESDEAYLLSLVQQGISQNISSSDLMTEKNALNAELSKLQSLYAGISSMTISSPTIQARQSVLSGEMSSIQEILNLLGAVQSESVPTPMCVGYNGWGVVSGRAVQFACGFPVPYVAPDIEEGG